MKKIATIFFLVLSIKAKSQLRWEEFYSESYFRIMLQQAKNQNEKINALGFLGKKGLPSDSIMKEIFAIADRANEKELKALALLWDARIHNDDTTRMHKLFQFAVQKQLIPYQITADLLLAEYYLHKGRARRSLFFAIAADSLLENLQGTKRERDSLKINVYRAIAHAYIYIGDAINTAKYLLSLRNYAESDKDEPIKMQAVEAIEDMYAENEEKKKSLLWSKMEHEYFKRTGQYQKYLGQTYDLALTYSRLFEKDSIPEDRTQALYYFAEMDKLVDSLNIYSWFIYYALRGKYVIGMLGGEEVIKLLDNNYNAHYHFSSQQSRDLKMEVYFNSRQFDSLKVYISKIDDVDKRDFWLKNYYLSKGEYDKAIPILKSFEPYLEKYRDFYAQQWLYSDFVKAYVGLKDYKLAYAYKLKSLQVKDTIDKLEAKEEIALMEMEKQIELQKVAFDDEQTKTFLRNRIRIYGFIAGLVALLIVALILWKNNRRKQKDKLKIEQAFNELKSTQQQLIQSEKMASLGELTAGIAHEIQNPLNFVNNFSEVNGELLKELKTEADKGNLEEVKAIANDIAFNSEKINHHGKRADAIVKGMLQHSRTSTGQKESTDINALCDEYLRLAYHGLRAKEKSFNAVTKTDFDNSIGKINIIPQDIGRVVLNLIHNAFYAVDEKKKQIGDGYEPTVSVSTKKNNGKVEIKVSDNGDGIPQKVLDKIFQPFFTTKPTGQGTGLGLSLAYDIVKAHGGEITVNTNLGEYTEFILRLPS